MNKDKFKSIKRLILLFSLLLLCHEAYHFVSGIRRSRPLAQEIISHSDDKLAYWLSKRTTHDDSLFTVLYNQAIDEAGTFQPSLHAFIYGITESRDIKKQVHCEVLLSHATTPEDTAFVRQTMLPPFRHTSERGFREEYRQRINSVMQHLNLQ